MRIYTFFYKVLVGVLRKAFRLTDFVYNKISFINNNINCRIRGINGKIVIRNDGNIRIGKNFKANIGKSNNPIGGDVFLRLIVKDGAVLEIGNNVGISNTTIVCWNSVVIQDYVYIGGGCKIWDTDFHSIDPYERRHNGDKKVNTAPIKINKYAFIGGESIILKGVTIGEYSIIGAGSVVVKSVPDREIWGGNPARFIRKIEIKEL